MKVERFMSKPIYVDALRYVENDRSDVFVFTRGKADFIIPSNTKQLALYVTTELGPKRTHPGDYIIRNADDTLTVLSPSEFEDKYIKVKSHGY